MFQENFQGYLTCEDCLWTSLKGMELSLEWVVFSLTASCSGVLYMLVIRQLKNSRVTSQNRRLTIAFAALWFSWIICVAPLLIWEPYLIRFREREGFIPKSFTSKLKLEFEKTVNRKSQRAKLKLRGIVKNN